MSLFNVVARHFGGEVKIIAPTRFPDSRGFFGIEYREDEFEELGIPDKFVQDNFSRSKANVLRGLHFQLHPSMAKLMRVTAGRALLVAVDIRPESPTFLKWVMTEASAGNGLQIWAPAYFARGFYALEDDTEVRYKCTGFFDSKSDKSIRWNDPAIGIEWPTQTPHLSDRDREAPTAAEFFGRSNASNIARTSRYQYTRQGIRQRLPQQ